MCSKTLSHSYVLTVWLQYTVMLIHSYTHSTFTRAADRLLEMLLFPSSAEYGITWDRVDSCGNALISLIAIDSNRLQHSNPSIFFLLTRLLLSALSQLFLFYKYRPFSLSFFLFSSRSSLLLSFDHRFASSTPTSTLTPNPTPTPHWLNCTVYHPTALLSTDSDCVCRLWSPSRTASSSPSSSLHLRAFARREVLVSIK